MAGNWNRCLEIATTKWVSMLHDDDVLLSNGIELLLAAERKLPGRALYFGMEDGIDDKGRIYISKANLVTHEVVEYTPKDFAHQENSFFCAAGSMLDRDIALSLRGFDTRLKMTSDLDMWVRLALYSGAVRLSEITARYRDYFDPQRGTTQQELTGEKLVRISVQNRRSQARIRSKCPDVALPPGSGLYLSGMARGILCKIGYRLSGKGRRIYFAYVARRYQGSGPLGRLRAALSCWFYVAYSFVRPYYLKLREMRAQRQ